MLKRIFSKIRWWLEESDPEGDAFGTNIRYTYRALKGLETKKQNH